MSDVIAPVRHILTLSAIRRVRKLPVPGTITVRVHESVQAQDVVAEAEVQTRHRYIDLARGLGIPPERVVEHLRREPGDRVESGDVIAGPVGMARRTVRAPGEGQIVTLRNGKLLFQQKGRVIEVRAGFPGTVVATDGIQSVTIETTGALVQGVWGNGRQDFGVLHLIGSGPGSRLQTGELDIQLRGGVLVAGHCENPAPFNQATDLSVRGIILGSMSANLIPLAQRLPYPVVVLECFGAKPIGSAMYELLASNAGREASVEGRPPAPYEVDRPEVIIPLPANREVDLPSQVLALSPGIRVRVTREPYLGQLGVVREIMDRAVEYDSGILATSAVVDMEGGGPKTVPLANLEIVG